MDEAKCRADLRVLVCLDRNMDDWRTLSLKDAAYLRMLWRGVKVNSLPPLWIA